MTCNEFYCKGCIISCHIGHQFDHTKAVIHLTICSCRALRGRCKIASNVDAITPIRITGQYHTPFEAFQRTNKVPCIIM